MRYHVLASDYDGTLAHHGRVDEPTLAALEKLLATGRRLVLVTGRELPELLEIFPRIDLFEVVVAENGALLYRPGTKEEKLLAEPPPERFVKRLRERGVQPISVGRSIVATWEPHENAVLETIRDLGLELQVIFNKGAVMVLPAGVSKASGLTAALHEMGLSSHNAVAVGDAENDHALLRMCEVSVAVANALPSLKETADYVTTTDHGAGVAELIAAMVADDLKDWEPRLTRHHLVIGKTDDADIALPPYGPALLISGPSASGKSTVAATILDALATQKYQFCIIDPEGDYETLEHATVLGGPTGRPVTQEVVQLLKNPEHNLVVSLTGMPIPDRPPFFLDLLPQILQLRAQTGRPHWLILDEAHHLMPADWKPPAGVLPEAWHNAVLITVHPELLAAPLLERVGTFLNVGADAPETLKSAAAAAKLKLPSFTAASLNVGEVLLWSPERDPLPRIVKIRPSRSDRRRHRRKYAEGELPPERSFYFKGPASKLNLRAQNLMMFLQIADGVDDETWEHHLRLGDYTRWFRDSIKDEALAAEANHIAEDSNLTAGESRKLMRSAIERDYTQPASRPLPVPGAS